MVVTPSKRQQVSLALSIVLLPAALLLFAKGFFPFKPVLPGLARHDIYDYRKIDWPFGRVIFMVVDALRSDFVYGHNSGFTYTQSLIRDGYALPYTAHASPPTVTMPRVKALTTGSVPSFLDLILNFAESDTSSSLASQDTWLAQLRVDRKGKLVFYGDDTWLKLFPNEDFFARQDGTSSFFVSDFTEVDNNVTRHLPDELAKNDWDGMILHYLGLDHIGHKTGPEGPNMLPKQKEMDDIVRMIFDTMSTNKHHKHTLLVLAGDHGMNAAGNHGGSGPGETEPALVLLSPLLKNATRQLKFECPTMPKEGTDYHFYRKVQQIDIVPTLAALLGIPIPMNNLGVVLEEVLDLFPHEGVVLWRNVEQMHRLVESKYGYTNVQRATMAYKGYEVLDQDCSDTGSDMGELVCKHGKSQVCEIAQKRYPKVECIITHMNYLHSAQNILSSSASSYSLDMMALGMLIAGLSLMLAIISLSPLKDDLSTIFLAVTSLSYGIMMFASSYVEEEQHFWHWLTPLWFLLLAIHHTSVRSYAWPRVVPSVAIIAIHRLCIRWNQTGQKHAGEPDIVHAFFPEHHQLMWFLILATYVLIGYRITTDSFGGLVTDELATPLALVVVLVAITFKLNFTNADAPELVQGLAARIRQATEPLTLVLQARLVFLLLTLAVALVTALSYIQGRPGIRRKLFSSRLQPLLTLFLATQTRAPNISLFLLMDLQSRLLQIVLHRDQGIKTSSPSPLFFKTTISALLLSYSSYFFFGGSNSISSLDLSNAYNGVADYNILAVGILLFASNWTGPIWWTVTCLTTLMTTKPMLDTSGRSWVAQERQKLKDDAAAAVDSSGRTEDSLAFAEWRSFVTLLTVFHAAVCLAVMAACTALRTHLFVWTVFSPKYLYVMAWSIGWHILVNCILGGALQALSVTFK